MRNPWLWVRAGLLASLAGVLALGASILLRNEPPADPGNAPAIRDTAGGTFRVESCRDCRSCHPREWAEWSASRHAVSWTNPHLKVFADLTLGIDDCVQCHAPAPVLVTGVADLPRERARERESGVDCLTCHQAAGGIAGPRGNPGSPCRAAERAELRGSAVCKGCHRTIGLDWEESPEAARGHQCQDCHMPRRAEGGGVPGGRSHDPRGGHDPEMLRKAFALEARVEGGEAVVSVAHRVAGHNVPGERHFRILFVEFRTYDAEGNAVEESRRVIRDVTPIRKARKDSKLLPGERVEFRFALPLWRGAFSARLLFKLYPTVLDPEALVVAEARGEFGR